MSAAVELRQVSKVYGSGSAEVHALREVDLSVQAGELVAVMGAERVRQEHVADHRGHPRGTDQRSGGHR